MKLHISFFFLHEKNLFVVVELLSCDSTLFPPFCGIVRICECATLAPRRLPPGQPGAYLLFKLVYYKLERQPLTLEFHV